jgi:hypothetical protein
LANRKGLKQGLLIDFIGNFVRSARAGLPVYRIDGGPGFVWAARFDHVAPAIVDHPGNKAATQSVRAEDAWKITESTTLDVARAPLERKELSVM